MKLNSETNAPSSNSFTVMRLVAAYFVVFSHSFGLLKIDDPSVDLLGVNLSKLGLWTFFSISGYLITKSAIRSKSLRSYLIKRSLRIFPALLAVILLTIFLLGAVATSLQLADYFSDKNTYRYFKNVLLFSNVYNLPGVFENNIYKRAVNGSLWTLQYEFILYLTTTLFIFISSKKKMIFLTVLLTLIMVICYTLGKLNHGLTIPFSRLNLFHIGRFGLLFMIGACCHLFQLDKIKISPWQTVLLVGILLITFHTSTEVSLILFPIVIINIGLRKNNFPFLDSIGDISYGVYLYSFPVQQLIIHQFENIHVFVLLVLTILVSSVLGFLSWILIERPALSLKHSFA